MAAPRPPQVFPRWLEPLRTLMALLSGGFILFFFSETLFWGRPGRASPAELSLTWLAYTVLAAALLWALETYRARGRAALFLGAALYGWLAEGVLAGTLYTGLPLSLSWTGLAWHALLSVSLGWSGLSRALRSSAEATLGAATLWGVFWALWATVWWQPAEGGQVTTLPAFAAHAWTQGGLLALALLCFSRTAPHSFWTRPWRSRVLLIVLLTWFALVTVPQHPLALLLAPVLLGGTLYSLRRNAQTPQLQGESVLTGLTARGVPLTRYALLLTLPAAASLSYAALLWLNWTLPVQWSLYALLTPLGLAVYGVSLWRAWYPRSS